MAPEGLKILVENLVPIFSQPFFMKPFDETRLPGLCHAEGVESCSKFLLLPPAHREVAKVYEQLHRLVGCAIYLVICVAIYFSPIKK